MRKLIPLLILCFIGRIHAQSWNWASGTFSTSYSIAYDIATDVQGFSYITGSFEDSTSFGSQLLTENGSGNAFLAKYDPAGNCIWAKKDTANRSGTALGIDNNRNSYVLEFLNAQHSLSRWDSSGNQIWTIPFPAGVAAENIYVDQSGYSFVVGRLTSGTWIVGPLVLTGPVAFIALYDPNGALLRLARIGKTGNILPVDVAVDWNGDPILACKLSGPDSLMMQPVTCNGSTVIMIKLDNAFNTVQFARGVALGAGSANASPFSLCLDAQGNSYVTAAFLTLDFAFGNDTIVMNASGRTPAVIRFDPLFNVAWTLVPSFTGTNNVDFLAITNDPNTLYLTGYTYEDFTLGNVSVTDTSNAYTVGFVIGIDLNGNTLFEERTSGNNSHIVPQGISTDNSGGIYVTGYRDHGIAFGPHTLPVTPGGDVFVAKVQTGPSAVPESPASSGISLQMGNQPKQFILLSDESHLAQQARFLVYDVSGRLVKTVPVNSTTTAIDCNDLSSGVYTWTVENAEERFAAGKLLNQ